LYAVQECDATMTHSKQYGLANKYIAYNLSQPTFNYTKFYKMLCGKAFGTSCRF
jgi:hypothetical protein